MKPRKSLWKVIRIPLVLLILILVYPLVSPLFINTNLNEALPAEFSNYQEPVREESTSNQDSQVPSPTLFEPETAPVPNPQPQIVYEADFEKVDYNVSGGYKIIESGGEYLLRIENLDISNGPDLVFAFSNTNQAWGNDNYVSITDLPANRGSYNVTIPNSINPDDFKYLLIHCRQFAHTFASADVE